MTMPGDARWAVFDNMADYQTWEDATAAALGVDIYSKPMPRQDPRDGTVAAKYRLSQNVWSGESLSQSEVAAMNYGPDQPPEE